MVRPVPPQSRSERRAQPPHGAPPDVRVAPWSERRAEAEEEVAPDVRIARIAARQDSVVHRRQLIRAGLTSGAIAHRVRAGRLFLVHRGVYAVGHPALTPRGRARAALLAVGRGAVLSHVSAGARHRLGAEQDGPVHVTVVGRRPRDREGIVLHETARLDRCDVIVVDGLPCTAPARTLLDVARDRPEGVERLVAEAQVLGLVTPASVAAAAARAPDHRGAGLVLRELEQGRSGPTRSELERVLRRLLRAGGLPEPVFNAELGRFHPDAMWRTQRVAIETDGWQAHHTRRAFERDRARDAELAAAGWVVLRFTWRQVTEQPLLVASRIAATLARRERLTV